MAKIYRTDNLLRRKAKRQLLSILFTWLSYIMLVYLTTLNIIGIGFFLSSLFTLYLLKCYRITKAGLKGEEKALSLVSELGDDYTVFSNLKVEYENKESETDLIVVGKKGVFVIEVKNHNGTIVGFADEKDWQQKKVGKKGGRYTADMYNPTKQVGTHVWRLSKTLRDQNLRVWVQGIVFFVNPSVKVEVETKQIPVLTLDRSFADYLNELTVPKELDDHVIRKIISVLKTKL